MKLVGLTAYSFCVRDEENNEHELHDIYERNFIDIINSEAGLDLNKYANDRDDESVFTFDKLEPFQKYDSVQRRIYDCLFMRVKTGEYGVESEIVDSETGNTNYTKKTDEADVMPFGCAIFVPAGKHTRGIIIFQSIGRFGIVTIMKKHIQEYLKRIDNNLRLVVEPIMPRNYAAKLFEKGILKSVRLVRYGIPDDDADRYGIDRGVKEIVEERVIKKPAGFMQNKKTQLRDFIDRKCSVTDVMKIENFEVDDLKLEFKTGKRIKTISLKNVDSLTISEDVTENVIIDNGHPTFSSLCSVMKETGEYYLRAKGALI